MTDPSPTTVDRSAVPTRRPPWPLSTQDPLGALVARLGGPNLLGWLAVAVLGGWVLMRREDVRGVPLGPLVNLAMVAVAAGLALGSGAWRATAPQDHRRQGTAVGAALRFAAILLLILAFAFLAVRRPLNITGRDALVLAASSAIVFLVALLVGRRRAGWPRPAEVLLVGAVAVFAGHDLQILSTELLRDLKIYLAAGQAFDAGTLPYLVEPLRTRERILSDLPFLYPPFTLPFFGFLARLPIAIVDATWILGTLAAGVAGLRILGVRWRWVPLLLAWPPFFVGIAVGNVAVFTFLLFVAAARWSWTLPVAATFKVQSAIPSIWLLREGRWRAFLAGIAVLAILVLATLPVVGIDAWFAWFRGLQAFQASQEGLHAMFGVALPRDLPYPVFLGLGVGAIILATLTGRGLPGLARLGLASIVASPSLFRHGFLIALPALLGASDALLWFTLGIADSFVGWWALVAIAWVTSVRLGVPRPASSVLHPLPEGGRAWEPVGTTGAPTAGAEAA